MQAVVLKPSKDKAIRQHHPWIFSGAVAKLPTDFVDGDVLEVLSTDGFFLGLAYFNRQSNIIGRMISEERLPVAQILAQKIQAAIGLRKSLFGSQSQTNAFRLINSEGDNLPGLIVDQYDELLVVQISTLGMSKLKDLIVAELIRAVKPKAIYEKSVLPSRSQEGLANEEGWLYQSLSESVIVKENGLMFEVDPQQSQKTGLFLDQREMRSLVSGFAKDRSVLNCFSYTGGFSIAALAGGALHATSIDVSKDAIVQTEKNVVLNHFSTQQHTGIVADVFEYLRQQEITQNLVILDPPAFAKKKADVFNACRGYKEINRLAMQKMPQHSFLLTCSCSYHVDEHLFQQLLFQSAYEAKRQIKILQKHHLAYDHPINIYHPEGEYLKSFWLTVD